MKAQFGDQSITLTPENEEEAKLLTQLRENGYTNEILVRRPRFNFLDSDGFYISALTAKADVASVLLEFPGGSS